jgi:endonuclease-3 related protein
MKKKKPSDPGPSAMRWYDLALAHFGPQHWWPGETPLEVCVGAILTQNTNWRNVEKAIHRLKAVNALDIVRLNEMSHEALADLIRPAGYYNIKAGRLKNWASAVCRDFRGDLRLLWAEGLGPARRWLLAINGIGRETADSMLLYAGQLPVFVVDAYTKRILGRHGALTPDSDYETVRAWFESRLPAGDVDLFNEYHALLVAVAKHFCLARSARCATCPLGVTLPTPASAAAGKITAHAPR